MLNLRRCVVGVVAVLLVGAAGCSSQTETDAANAGDAAKRLVGSIGDSSRALAEQGNADAQTRLGDAYSNGRGVPQDYVEAVSWYRQAAEQGGAGAQYILGLMYRDGRQGVPQDAVEAASWWRKAAEQRHTPAQSSLGYAYYTGQGVPQDYVESHKWFNLAASRASAEDQKEYAENRDLLASLMTPQQIADAQKLAREWQAAFEQRGGK